MIKRFFLAAPFFICALSFSQALASYDNLVSIANRIQTAYSLPGFALSIDAPGAQPVDVSVGLSDIATMAPLTRENVFRVGSVTKTMTADIIMSLYRSGKLDLFDNITEYLPDYPQWKSVTVVELLNQTSGIPDYINTPDWWENVFENPQKQWKSKDLVGLVSSLRLTNKPGKAWRYSNTNYVLLGMIISEVTGKSYSSVLKERLTSVYNLRSTGYELDSPMLASHVSQGYYMENKNVTHLNPSWLNAAGGVLSTPHDLVRWAHAFFELNNNALEDKNVIVGVKSGRLNPGYQESAYSLGIIRMNTPNGLMWFVPGLTNGFRSAMIVFPCSGVTVAYASNNSAFYRKGFHSYAITEIITSIMQDDSVKLGVEAYQANRVLPAYCKALEPSAGYEFPKF